MKNDVKILPRLLLLCSILSLVASCGRPSSTSPEIEQDQPTSLRPPAELNDRQAAIYKTNIAEDLVLSLSPRLNELKKHLENKPCDLSGLFDGDVLYRGPEAAKIKAFLDHPELTARWLQAGKISTSTQASKVSQVDGAIWAPLTKIGNIEQGKFGVVRGVLRDDSDTFEMDTAFEGTFYLEGTGHFGVKATQTLVWELSSDRHWYISQWQQNSFSLIAADKTLFEDVTRLAIPDGDTLLELTSSKHEEMLKQRASNPMSLLGREEVLQYFTDWTSLFQYTSASVVDIDKDGWDDLFVVDRLNKSVLLRNNGDGTFEDVAEKFGLNFENAHANCALFADFDNDGDPDLLVGRSLAPSLFFKNERGRFVPDKETNDQLHTVRFVSSGSVVDINNDGLLDVYLSTYATRSGEDFAWVQYAVPPAQQAMMLKKMSQSHPFVDRRGPPNVLLLNKQGTLKRVSPGDELAQWRNSFQTVWIDYDEDGDQDVYLCNDFAPDALLQNNTRRGSYQPLFLDVTSIAFPGNSMGFGMGASLGDFNSDGQLDLYVSNMYSKAGQRIIRHFGGEVDPRIATSARGNFLYQKQESQFKQVAGKNADQQHVSKVGWSFGGQFADFNNDSQLDIYVPSGFFTAPQSIAAEVDL